MHFLLMTLKVVYVLTTPMPELMENATVEAIRIRTKWENDDYICRGHILNDMSNSLFDAYMNVKSAKELWDSIESKPVMEQYNELLRIFKQHTQHGLKMDKCISVSSITDKLPPSWKDFKHTLKHDKNDLCFDQLGSHLRIEESLRAQDSDKGNGKEVVGPSVNITEEDKSKQKKQNKDSDATTRVCKDCCWFKTFEPMEDGSVLYMGDEHFAPVHHKGSVALEFSSGKTATLFNVLYVPKLPPYTPQQNGVAERKNRALKEMVNSMLSYTESRDTIFDENRFSSIPRPMDIIPNVQESLRDDHSDDLRDQEIKLEYYYSFSIEEDPRNYNEAMQSWDAAFWKEAINDKIGSIMENNTWILSDLPPGCKWIFKRKTKVDGTIDKFKAQLVIQGFRQKERIDYFDTYAPVARITTIRLLLALAVIHNLVIHKMDVKTTFLNGDLDEDVYMKQPKRFVMPSNEHKVCKLVKSLYGLKQAPKQYIKSLMRLSRFTSNPSRQHWKAITRVFKYLRDSSSTSGWVFLLEGGAISWDSKKQICITSSTMEYEFIALAAAGEVVASNHERKKSFPSWKQQEAGQKQNFKKGSFRNQQMTERIGWRMWVDFKDLDKACPKDGYPLPEIDWRVEPLCGKGTFLGYKVDADGLRVCLDKVEAVFNLPSLKCLKDVQKLNRKFASLNRNLSKSAEKSLPFFKTLKKCTKKSDFQWTAEAEMAFKQMKRLIAKLPMLTAPKEKEELIMYLATTKEAINFITERLEDDTLATPIEDPKELPDSWVLFMDRSSCIDGFGAGLIITNPEGMEFTYALRFRFKATNNEAEYEALIAGLRIAEQMGVKNLYVNADSKLMANQVNGVYVAKEPGMIKYLEKVKNLIGAFKDISIKQVPRGENKKADALSKIASTSFAHLKEKKKARVIRRKAGRYAMLNGILYKKSFLGPWLRCVEPLQANYVLREIHEGSYSMHSRPRSMVAKVLRSGSRKGQVSNSGNGLFHQMDRSKTCGNYNGSPVDIRMPTMRTAKVDMFKNDEALEVNLDLLEEKREHAAIQEAKSKAMMEKYYNTRVRSIIFRLGDLVYRSNKAS
nr:zinc finger, CCHC-type [Tanacetum cinerariifolium]